MNHPCSPVFVLVFLFVLAVVLLLAAWIWRRASLTEQGDMFYGSSRVLIILLFFSFVSILAFIGYNLWQIGGC